jgi:hypothetical protein
LSANERVRDRKHLERVLEEISERLDRTIGDAMAEIERAEREESGEYRLPASMQDGLKRKQRIQEALKELDASEKKVVHPSEPEARFMKNRRTKDLSYNAQAVADEKSGLIVAQDVVTEGVDYGQLVAMLDKVEENLGAVAEETVADGGYFSSGQIGLAEERSLQERSFPREEQRATPITIAGSSMTKSVIVVYARRVGYCLFISARFAARTTSSDGIAAGISRRVPIGGNALIARTDASSTSAYTTRPLSDTAARGKSLKISSV